MNITPKAIVNAKNMPIKASSDVFDFFLKIPISIAISHAKRIAERVVFVPIKRPNAIPPKAE